MGKKQSGMGVRFPPPPKGAQLVSTGARGAEQGLRDINNIITESQGVPREVSTREPTPREITSQPRLATLATPPRWRP